MWNRLIGITLLGVLWSPWASGVSTKFWSSTTFEDFARGNFTGISLSREGQMTLAPRLEEVFSTDQAMVWAVAQDKRGNVYLGTGHSGKVFRLGPDLNGSLLFDAPEPDVFALAVDPDGRLYAGTSPDGKIYKIDESGQAQEFFDPQSKYIWAMTFAPDGALYVGTGDRGKIYRVESSGEGKLFYETHQSHIMSLAVTSDNDLIAGSEPNGLLYRLSSSGRGFVLYDAPLAEVHSVAIAADGTIYASAMGVSRDRRLRRPRPQTPGQQAPLRTTTTITVRAAEDTPVPPGDPGEGPGRQEEPNPDNASPGQSRVRTTTVSPAGVSRIQGRRTIRSALFRVAADSTVETLWNSFRESIFDLLPSGNNLLFSTDQKGRIYELTPDRQVSLLTQTDQEETTRLIPYEDFVLVTTANLGKVFRLGTQPADSGAFESEVRDAGSIASWGKMRWTAETPAGTSLELLTRSGNSRRPDSTWSDWSDPRRQPAGEQISSPPARYIQWKAVFRSAANRSPVLREVTLAYLPRNRAPVVTEVKVTSRGQNDSAETQARRLRGGTLASSSTTTRGFSAYASPRSATQRGPDTTNMTWLANDPDRDELTYRLYFRGEGEKEWKLLEEGLKQNYFRMKNEALPDGKYRIRVVVSDASVNPAGMAKTAEKISSPFLVDGTPPQVELQQTARAGSSATARFRAFDAASVLTRAEYAIDADPPQQLLSEDGIIDSLEEAFSVPVEKLDGQEHLLTLRVYDSAGNVGFGKALLPALSAGSER